jgi:hypothetical protein
LTEVFERRGSRVKRVGEAQARPWGRPLNRTPLQHARYLESRDGRQRAQEYAYQRMKGHEAGSLQATFWHAVWRLLR